ncbi:Mgm101p [Sugiyamaella lignohabitans]|uniref:Mitochondrial genome maintenance protein MGM101 n=1 Tax=Sugiyamaella lignohabitans TaxID=796027 RepID=A0A161HKT6_9ASCO|nr:Mgm101p [Sugiyamaella lignohabitans]ANB13737.1 Mgm101p [Sugiyamaella lignohabitans]
MISRFRGGSATTGFVRGLKTATSYKSSVAVASRPVKSPAATRAMAPAATVRSGSGYSSARKSPAAGSGSSSSARYATAATSRSTRTATSRTKTAAAAPAATSAPAIDPAIFEGSSVGPSSGTIHSSKKSSSATPAEPLASNTIDSSGSASSAPPTFASSPTSTTSSAANSAATRNSSPHIDLAATNSWTEFDDSPVDEGVENGENWTRSFRGLGSEPFASHVTDTLLAELKPEEIEITPDGLLFLPEIRYRRVLNRAFGPGGWGLAPRSKTLVTAKSVSREYALICHGRLVAIARGEQDYFDPNGITTAMEGCKSNAMMRCCKDLGIASELWDPFFIRDFKTKYCEQKYFEKKRRMVWKRKDREWEYPYK